MTCLLILLYVCCCINIGNTNQIITIKNIGAYKGWDDATFAESCE